MGYLPVETRHGHRGLFAGRRRRIKAWFKSFTRGEISDLTSLIYDAREHAIGLIRDEAETSAPTTWSASRPTFTKWAT